MTMYERLAEAFPDAIAELRDGRPRLKLTRTTRQQLDLESQLVSNLMKAGKDWHLGNYGMARRNNEIKIKHLIQGFVEDAYLLGKRYVDNNHDTRTPIIPQDLEAIKKITADAVASFWYMVQQVQRQEAEDLAGLLSKITASMARIISKAVNMGTINTLVANFANQIAASQLDMLPLTPDQLQAITPSVEFVTMRDGSVCDICQPYDGQRFDIDMNTGIIIDGPTLPDDTHPNCRCRYLEVSGDELQIG